MSIWKKEEVLFNEEIFSLTDDFFEGLNGSKKYEYREGQHTMALDILETIKNKEILMVEAEVGSGKSWGYLVPLLYASKDNKNFSFLVSTASIGLQEQLKEEIKKISEMLDINVNVVVAKGRNNFICQKRLEHFIKKCEDKEFANQIKERFDQGIIDKEEYSDIPSSIWKSININKVNCMNCIHNNYCRYMLERKKWPNANAVICNHDLLVESLKRDTDDMILKDPSILVVDESHALEEKIRNSYKISVDKNILEYLIQKINIQISDDMDIFTENPLICQINNVFRLISTKAKYEYRKTAKTYIEILDCETSSFKCTPNLVKEVKKLNTLLASYIDEASSYEYLDIKLQKDISMLKNYAHIFIDLIKPDDERENLYWASFVPNTTDHIILECVQKNIAKVSANLLSNPNYGKVFTSATMTTKQDDYSYFEKGLGIDTINGIPITREFSLKSPYDYENNSILYLADDVISPKSPDHELYLSLLALKINKMINITNGRSLVLFTSKKDMQDVYNKIIKKEHNFNIYLQDDTYSTDNLKVLFANDSTSTLFATGSFWEGIDIKGESLQNVIITKLPFPVVTPVTEEKANYYKDGFNEVYLKEMLIKLKQGTGRLIRSSTDKGIVSILDSRVKDYKEDIIEALPFTNITTDINEVESFSTKKLCKINQS